MDLTKKMRLNSEKISTKIIFLRHGETANARMKCYNGHFDVDLSKNGKKQIEDVSLKFINEKIGVFYSSDLKRSRLSAQIIANKHSQTVISNKMLREVSFGRWEGLSYEEIKEKYFHEMQKKYSDYTNYRIKDGGENFKDLSLRVISKLKDIISNHKNETILLALHGGVNRVILGWALNIELKYIYRIKQDFAAINIINYYHDTDEKIVELVNG